MAQVRYKSSVNMFSCWYCAPCVYFCAVLLMVDKWWVVCVCVYRESPRLCTNLSGKHKMTAIISGGVPTLGVFFFLWYRTTDGVLNSSVGFCCICDSLLYVICNVCINYPHTSTHTLTHTCINWRLPSPWSTLLPPSTCTLTSSAPSTTSSRLWNSTEIWKSSRTGPVW